MTAIIGFTCHDSILMMADTEESTSYGKSTCDKLYHFASPSGYMLTGGAGDAHLIDSANQALYQFMQAGMPGTPKDAQLSLKLVLDGLNIFAQKFFNETTKVYKKAGLDPLHEFALLIAVNIVKHGTYLFKLYLNKVLWIEPPKHQVIGCGDTVIHPMLSNFQFDVQKETALFCGLRMMYIAKNTVPDVGGKTDAVALLNNGDMIWYGSLNTARIEALVLDYDKFLGGFVDTSISNVAREPHGIDKHCEDFFQHDVPAKLKECRDRYKDLLDHPIL